jgi:5-methylcytosine-specific restriction enzyme subunit McrC
LTLDELGPPQAVRLSASAGRALAVSGVVDAQTDPAGEGTWLVRAAGKVGVARVGDMEIWVQPKVPIDRLLFLVGYALNPVGWRAETAQVDAHDDLVPAVTQALGRQSEHALRQGLIQGYQVREDSAPVLRGRLREADQLRRRFGLALPVEIRYDEFTTDIAENQILRATAERMLRVPRVDADAKRRLRHVLALLADVSSLVPGLHPRGKPPGSTPATTPRYDLRRSSGRPPPPSTRKAPCERPDSCSTSPRYSRTLSRSHSPRRYPPMRRVPRTVSTRARSTRQVPFA